MDLICHVDKAKRELHKFREIAHRLNASNDDYFRLAYKPNEQVPFEVFCGEHLWRRSRDSAVATVKYGCMSNTILDELLENSHRCQYRHTCAYKAPAICSRSEAMLIAESIFSLVEMEIGVKSETIHLLSSNLPQTPDWDYQCDVEIAVEELKNRMFIENVQYEMRTLQEKMSFSHRRNATRMQRLY